MDLNPFILVIVLSLVVLTLVAPRLTGGDTLSINSRIVTENTFDRPGYTPNCAISCYLPIEFSMNKDWVVDISKLKHTWGWIRDGIAPNVTVRFGRLQNVTRPNSGNWKAGCAPWLATYPNGTQHYLQNCTDRNNKVFKEWVWYTPAQANGFNAIAGENYTIIFETHNKAPKTSVDLIPLIQGFNLTQYAAWGGVTMNLNDTYGLLVRYEFNCTNQVHDRGAYHLDLWNKSGTAYKCVPDENGVANGAIEFTGSSYLQNSSHARNVFPANKTLTVVTIINTAALDQRTVWSLSNGVNIGLMGNFGAFAVGGNGISYGMFGASFFMEVKNAQQPTSSYLNNWSCFTYEWNGTGAAVSTAYTVYLSGIPLTQSNVYGSDYPYVNSSFNIGSYNDAGASQFIGNMSMFTVYNRRLNNTEILALCDGFDPLNVSGAAPPPAGGDSCTYSGTGNFIINCTDMCNLSTATTSISDDLIFSNVTGNGAAYVYTKLDFNKTYFGCRVFINNSGGIV